jgi:hypothetical protein
MQPTDESLLGAGRDELSGGFHPLRLWRDRCRILAEPAIAARPHPPLSNAPLRFALSLSLTPILVIGWLVSQTVELLPTLAREAPRLETRSLVAIEALEAELPGLDRAALEALAKQPPSSADMPPPYAELRAQAKDLVMADAGQAPAARRAALGEWIRSVRSSTLTAGQQQILLARQLRFAQAMRRGDLALQRLQRNLSEGGPVMQITALLATLLSAWLFRQALQGDARFPHAQRADRFYLWYSTSRIFWFIPAQTLSYGLGAYASATGHDALLRLSQSLTMAIGLGSLAWLLAGSPAMARALADSASVPPGGAWAVGWRMLATYAVAMLVVMLVLVPCVVGIGIAAALWS